MSKIVLVILSAVLLANKGEAAIRGSISLVKFRYHESPGSVRVRPLASNQRFI